MNITSIGHASILVEAAGLTVLSDPWWAGPCFGAQWWTYPLPYLKALDGQRIDYIYISHGHHDHFHPGTLATMPKTARVLVASSLGLAPAVRELGFEVDEINADEPRKLGAQGLVEARIVPTHGDDTLLTLSDGHEVCVNLNDALHSAPEPVQKAFIQRLRRLHPKIDYAFCGYGVASHFPNCYRVPGKDDAATAAQRQAYFNRQWVRVIAGLEPRFGFPFAADVVFLQDELFWANEATHNSERPTAVFRATHAKSATTVIDIAPGFQIRDGRVVAMKVREPLHEARLREELGAQIQRANRVAKDDGAVVAEVVQLLEANLANCRAYLATFPGDYCMALAFSKSQQHLVLTKRGADVSLHAAPSQPANADLIYTTRGAYLRWALKRPFGDELLFVGSGGIFEYKSRDRAAEHLHRELITLIRNNPPEHRTLPVAQRGLLFKAKQAAKRALGRHDRDLYDLLGWTVFEGSEAARDGDQAARRAAAASRVAEDSGLGQVPAAAAAGTPGLHLQADDAMARSRYRAIEIGLETTSESRDQLARDQPLRS